MYLTHQVSIIAHSDKLVKLYRCASIDVVKVVADLRVYVSNDRIVIGVRFWVDGTKDFVEAVTASTRVYDCSFGERIPYLADQDSGFAPCGQNSGRSSMSRAPASNRYHAALSLPLTPFCSQDTRPTATTWSRYFST